MSSNYHKKTRNMFFFASPPYLRVPRPVAEEEPVVVLLVQRVVPGHQVNAGPAGDEATDLT